MAMSGAVGEKATNDPKNDEVTAPVAIFRNSTVPSL
jgi:hypothetical protein